MKCLSVKQPHASRIASGRKVYEIRTWRTEYRGPLLICAGKQPARGYDSFGLPRGVAVCRIVLAHIRPFTPDMAEDACVVDWRPGAWAWVLSDPEPVAPQPVSGKLGLFSPPEGLRL